MELESAKTSDKVESIGRSDVARRFELAQKAFAERHFKTAAHHADYVMEHIEEGFTGFEVGETKNPLYSIVVLTYRHSDDVYKLVERMVVYDNQEEYELVFVDNGNEHLLDILYSKIVRFKYYKTHFNIGCSGGRNIGALNASGDYVLFIDDDGILGEGAVEALVSTIRQTGAVTVRGRVEPKSPDGESGGNYDKGRSVIESLPDAEGISIWRKDDFLAFGGFDILLSGHEGLRLFCKMFRFRGASGFLYTPDALLQHDFANDAESRARKEDLHQRNRSYLDFVGAPYRELVKQMRERAESPKLAFLAGQGTAESSTSGDMEPVDVITTVLNGREFIDDYISGWSQQTYQNFNLIVVDDGSSDQGVQYLEAHWPFPDRLTVVRTQGVGRSAALNLAIQSTTSDILAIADVDDVPLPNRLMETARYFERNPDMSMVSFYSFSEEKSMRAAQPLSVVGVSLLARSLLGMPASFPTFGFRKSKFTEAFDEELTAGVDCDWIHRNIVAGCGDGHMMPMEQVYYRVHDTQISSKKAGLQKTVATKAVWDSHARLLGELSEDDKHQALVFSRWKPIKSGAELPAIFAYCSRLAGGTRGAELYDSDDVRAFIWMVYEELRGQLLERDGRNWRKTALELKKERVDKSVVNTETGETECPPRHYGLFGWRWILVPFVRPFVRRLGTERDLEFFNSDPAGFMMTLTRPGHVRIRRWLFPQ